MSKTITRKIYALYSGTAFKADDSYHLLYYLKTYIENLASTDKSIECKAYDGIGVGSFPGMIWGTGVTAQAASLTSYCKDLLEKNKTLEIELCLYGHSRGAITVLQVPNHVAQLPQEMRGRIKIRLAAFDPVPGNSLWGIVLNPFGSALARSVKTVNTERVQKGSRVMLCSSEPIFHGASIPLVNPDKVDIECIYGQHVGAQSPYGGGGYKFLLIYAQTCLALGLAPDLNRLNENLNKYSAVSKDIERIQLEQMYGKIHNNEELLHVFYDHRCKQLNTNSNSTTQCHGPFAVRIDSEGHAYNKQHAGLYSQEEKSSKYHVRFVRNSGLIFAIKTFQQKYRKTALLIEWLLGSLAIFGVVYSQSASLNLNRLPTIIDSQPWSDVLWCLVIAMAVMTIFLTIQLAIHCYYDHLYRLPPKAIERRYRAKFKKNFSHVFSDAPSHSTGKHPIPSSVLHSVNVRV